MFYTHRFTKLEDKVNYGHFQLLRNVKAVSPYDIYFAMTNGICHYSFKDYNSNPQIVISMNSRFSMTVFDVLDNFFALGNIYGEISIFDNQKENYMHNKFKVAPGGEGMIVNCV